MNAQVRVKWSRIKTSVPFEEITSYFKSNCYSESDGFGYSVFDYYKDEFLATYTEKVLRSEVSISPLGDEIVQEVVQYNSVRFSILPITNKIYLLTVFNPPKSIRFLVDRICKDFDYNVGVGAIDVNLVDILSLIDAREDVNLLKVSKVKVSNLVVGDSSKASIEIISSKDAMKDIKEVTRGRKFNIDKVKFSCLLNKERYEVEMSKSGCLTTTEEQLPFYTSLLIEQMIRGNI